MARSIGFAGHPFLLYDVHPSHLSHNRIAPGCPNTLREFRRGPTLYCKQHMNLIQGSERRYKIFHRNILSCCGKCFVKADTKKLVPSSTKLSRFGGLPNTFMHRWVPGNVDSPVSGSENGHQRKRFVGVRASVELASGGMDIINNLGLDSLTFLAATVLVVPVFKALKASPILGFLLSGVVLNQLGLIRNVTDVKALSELGILFLLFEMGLELSLARLKALAKYALGIGLAQVFFSTLVFTAFELPPNGAIGTRLLEFLFHARPDLVNIRSVDEAIVIGAGLSLSSSAFVLQLLAEKGELPTRFGSATLGILLLQDIAVVPLLVILPILESGV